MTKGCLVVAMLLLGGVADAKVLEVYVQAQGGGGSGRGLSGDQKDADFFAGAEGGMFGVKLGAELLFLDGWVEHNDYYDGDISGTWTQFMFGGDVDFAISDPPAPDQKPKTYAQVGLAIGFGMGTGQQVDPPLDNTEITDKGFVAQAAIGIEHRFSKIFGVGVTVPLEYGYLFKNELGMAAANDLSKHYHSLSASALLTFRVFIDVK